MKEKHPPPDCGRALPPPQYRLRTLLWMVAAACVLFAAMAALGPYATFALLLVIASAAAHVTATSLGKRLRDSGRPPLNDDHERERRENPPPYAARPHHFAPATRLSQRRRLGWPITALVVLGAAAGAVGGGYLLVWDNGGQAATINIAFGVFASGVLGGMAGFCGGAFVRSLFDAASQAGAQR